MQVGMLFCQRLGRRFDATGDGPSEAVLVFITWKPTTDRPLRSA